MCFIDWNKKNGYNSIAADTLPSRRDTDKQHQPLQNCFTLCLSDINVWHEGFSTAIAYYDFNSTAVCSLGGIITSLSLNLTGIKLSSLFVRPLLGLLVTHKIKVIKWKVMEFSLTRISVYCSTFVASIVRLNSFKTVKSPLPALTSSWWNCCLESLKFLKLVFFFRE